MHVNVCRLSRRFLIRLVSIAETSGIRIAITPLDRVFVLDSFVFVVILSFLFIYLFIYLFIQYNINYSFTKITQ